MNHNVNLKGFGAIIAVALMVCVSLAPVFGDASDADTAAGSANITIQPGQTWYWTPTFPSGLSPEVTVSASDTSMPDTSATFGTTSGYATVGASNQISVSIPSEYTGDKYYVLVKAVTTLPSQVATYALTFTVATYTLNASVDTLYANAGHAITNIEFTFDADGSQATVESWSTNGTLPAGLNFTNGVISGTPTGYSAQSEFTVTAHLTGVTPPNQTVSKTISIGSYTDITAEGYTVYAITGQTSVSIPGFTMPEGTALDKVTNTGGDTSISGLTFANDGGVAGTPSAAGSYTVKQKATATTETGGSSAERVLTIVVENKVAITGSDSFNSYYTHSDSITLSNNSGTSGTWSIVSVTGGSSTGFSVSETGVLTCDATVVSGTYTVTVKLATNNTTVTSSGATGGDTGDNYVTKVVTVYVADDITLTAEDHIYMATNGVFDSYSASSNISGATFALSGNSDILSYVTMGSSTGVVTCTQGAQADEYTVTITVTDPNNSTNTATQSVTVVVEPQLVFTNEAQGSFTSA